MVTYADLRDADPKQFSQAADAWEELANAIASHHQQLGESVVSGLEQAWQGPSATKARERFAYLQQEMQYHELGLRDVANTLRALGTDLASAHGALHDALAVAQQWGLDVSEDGSVSVNPEKATADLNDPTMMKELPEAMDRIASAILQAVDNATQVDVRTIPLLRKSVPQTTGTPTPATQSA
jgi:uncharacterized protein YukE